MSSARPRLWVTARLQVSAPGQATTSRASSAPGSAMPMASSRSYSSRELLLGEVTEHQVLAVGDPHVEPELRAGWSARPRNWSEVMSPSRAVGVRATRCPWPRRRTTLAVSQRAVRVARPSRSVTGRAHRVGSTAGRHARRARRRAPRRRPGCRPGQVADGEQEPPLLEDRARAARRCPSCRPATSSGPAACCRGCRSGRRSAGSPRSSASSSSRGVNSSSAWAGCGLAPSPPATKTRKPGFDGPVRAGLGDGDHADVVEHGLAAVGGAAREVDLELARQPLRVSGGAGKCRNVASAHGRDVEHLERAGAGQVAARRRCAPCRRTPRGSSGPTAARSRSEHRDPLELHEVELDVLAGREVAPAAAVARRRRGRASRAARG